MHVVGAVIDVVSQGIQPFLQEKINKRHMKAERYSTCHLVNSQQTEIYHCTSKLGFFEFQYFEIKVLVHLH